MRIFLMIFIGLLAITGCSQTHPNPKINMQQAGPNNQTIAYPQQISTHLEHLAVSFPQVQSAHVVMLGKVAIVGINVSPELPLAQVDNLKYSVSEALHKDPNGAQ